MVYRLDAIHHLVPHKRMEPEIGGPVDAGEFEPCLPAFHPADLGKFDRE